MRIFITNINGYGKTDIERVAQNMVTDICVRTFGAYELGLYKYDMNTDSETMLNARLDGILGSVTSDDVVILQTPTWNTTHFDKAILTRLKIIAPGVKIIAFIHDMPPYMMESERWLIPLYNDIYNQADVVIVPTQKALEVLRESGMNVPKVVIQHMWDHIVTVDTTYKPSFNKNICFAGNVNKFAFVKDWKYSDVSMSVTADSSDWMVGANIRPMGWFKEDTLLVNELRKAGGFGLHWCEDPYWWEYMKMNASFKLSLYLAAGLPVIVPVEHPEKELIVSKNLGIAVKSLDEAVEVISSMSNEQYERMTDSVDEFAHLIRDGYFIKKLVMEAIFKLYYE